MIEPFIPWEPGRTPPPQAASAKVNLKVLPQAATSPAFQPFSPPSTAHVHVLPVAQQPVITLQKEGDKVTGLRIECVCGQVIDLACVYS